MPGDPSVRVMERLRAVAERDKSAPTDGELLRRFTDHRDDSALAALVRRHGPMVWGVCRRLLAHHDAEDAFQATFLVLVRKAPAIRPREAVANWLHGVAHRTALMARRTVARRKVREAQAAVSPEAGATAPDPCDHVPLDQELSRLPDRFRAVLVLCDLEGQTRTEAARQLGVPEGTVAGRLARARTLLAKRLTRRGVALAVGAMAASSVSESVAHAVSPTAEALSTQVIRAMNTSKFSILAAAALLTVAVTVFGLAVGQQVPVPKSLERPKPPDTSESWVVGQWAIQFENGVNESCSVSKDGSAKTQETRRTSPGKIEVRDGAILIVSDDDRLERWTSVGKKAVVEHWFPASAYPKQKPVVGIAERVPENDALSRPADEKPPHIVEKPDMKGRMDSGLPWKLDREPTEETIRVATKTFVSKMGSYPDYRFREFFDPRYLKEHKLTDKDIAFEVVGGYRGLHNYVVADDNRTILCTLLRNMDGKEVRELFLLRWVYHDGCLYVSPGKAPDPKTGIFTPWILRTKP